MHFSLRNQIQLRGIRCPYYVMLPVREMTVTEMGRLCSLSPVEGHRYVAHNDRPSVRTSPQPFFPPFLPFF